MDNAYIHGGWVTENDEQFFVADMPPQLTDSVRRAVARGDVYALFSSLIPGKTGALFLYTAATEAFLLAGACGARDLFTLAGALTGKSAGAARRCMTYIREAIPYEKCNERLFGGVLSPKAFSYVTVPGLVAAAAAAVIRGAGAEMPPAPDRERPDAGRRAAL